MKKKQRGEVMARKLLILLILISCVAIGASGDTEVPNTFVSGETASAAEVNENFEALADAIDAAPQYGGASPIHVDARTIGLNAATSVGDVLAWDGTNWIAVDPYGDLLGVNNVQPFLAINYIIALVGTYPSRNFGEPWIGEVKMFGGNFAPRGYAFCDGQLLPIAQNTALFSLLGTTFGGDGRTTFGLPDLRGRVPIHVGQGPGLRNRRWGDSGGSENVEP